MTLTGTVPVDGGVRELHCSEMVKVTQQGLRPALLPGLWLVLLLVC